jgi:glycosyltransferase involved in cell wall biosynthesis
MAADDAAGNGRKSSPSLSLVIPAYNEAARIAATARAAADHLANQPYATELLVVDDGSDDATADLARVAVADVPFARVLSIPHAGKAAALRAGLTAARLDLVAFSDADLAVPLDALADLRAAVARGCDIAIGSREGVGARRLGEPEYRHLMGRAFNAVVRLLLLPGIHDTQCGFKLFRREVLADILDRARLYRDGSPVLGPRVTAFDVELLAIARGRGWRICAEPVVWTYGEGSKVQPLRDSWHNVRDVVTVWANQKRGFYR